MYIQHVKYQSELISPMYVHCQLHALPVIHCLRDRAILARLLYSEQGGQLARVC